MFRVYRPLVTYAWVMPLQITLAGINAPVFTPSSSISIETRSTSGFLMSRDTSMTFTTACTLPCRTCSVSDLTVCTGCYSDPLLVSGKTMLSGSQCVAACANKFYFNNATSQCDSCSSLC